MESNGNIPGKEFTNSENGVSEMRTIQGKIKIKPKFREGNEWSENFWEEGFENLGIPLEAVLFSRKFRYCLLPSH